MERDILDSKLLSLIESRRIPHTLVIDGGTYEQRISIAKDIAAASICEDPDKPHCGVCAACKKADAGIHPDIITILPENGKKTLSIKVIRDMREDAYIVPNEAKLKVYIIARAELMEESTQNALLKILEEPPSYASFILLCPTHSILLPTVLSRSSVFDLDDVASDISSEVYTEASNAASEIATAVAEKNEIKLFKATTRFEKDFSLLSPTLDCFELILRDALVIGTGGKTLISSAQSQASKLATGYSQRSLLSLQAACADIVRAINIYSNKNLTITRLCSLLMAAANAQ